WLADILDSDDAIVETLDAHYEDVESLCNLQNVFKIFNWWSRRQKEL
ncbi:hypothetical protein ALC60_01754, partial [Trachymyrmex zeteki]